MVVNDAAHEMLRREPTVSVMRGAPRRRETYRPLALLAAKRIVVDKNNASRGRLPARHERVKVFAEEQRVGSNSTTAVASPLIKEKLQIAAQDDVGTRKVDDGHVDGLGPFDNDCRACHDHLALAVQPQGKQSRQAKGW